MTTPKPERTLVLVKSDGVKRGLVGEIIGRFERVGLQIVGLKVVQVDEAIALKHYGQNDDWFERVGEKMRAFYEQNGLDMNESLRLASNRELGEKVQKWNISYLIEGKVVAMVLEGYEAVSSVRKMVGATYPKDALPGTIRGDYSQESPLTSNLNERSVRNLVHASGSPAEAKFEIELWFKNNELLA